MNSRSTLAVVLLDPLSASLCRYPPCFLPDRSSGTPSRATKDYWSDLSDCVTIRSFENRKNGIYVYVLSKFTRSRRKKGAFETQDQPARRGAIRTSGFRGPGSCYRIRTRSPHLPPCTSLQDLRSHEFAHSLPCHRRQYREKCRVEYWL